MEQRMLNLPNFITLSRLFLVIVFAVALARDGVLPGGGEAPMDSCAGTGSIGSMVALWAFVLGALTDFLDGYLARKWQQVTDFGKLMDPLADKILVCSAFIYLTYIGMCPFWVTILIVFREFLVTGIRQIALTHHHVIAAERCGKWKTGIQLAFCIACLFHLAYAGHTFEPLRTLSVGETAWWFRQILLWVSVGLTIWSGMFYCMQARSFLFGGRK